MKKMNGFTVVELMITLVVGLLFIGLFASVITGISSGFSAVSYGFNGLVETRCINGYKTNVTRYSSEQIRDDQGHGIKC